MQTQTRLEDLVLLGWCLIQRKARSEYRDSPVPEVICTVSDCICTVYPEISHDYGAGYFEFMQTTQQAQEDLLWLRSWEEAAHINANWLEGQYEILGIAAPQQVLTGQEWATILDDNSHRTFNALPFNGTERVLGYDALCFDVAVNQCSYFCNDLEKELIEQFHGQYNEEGLITDQNTAISFAKWVNDESNAEPGLWLPVAYIKDARSPLHGPERPNSRTHLRENRFLAKYEENQKDLQSAFESMAETVQEKGINLEDDAAMGEVRRTFDDKVRGILLP